MFLRYGSGDSSEVALIGIHSGTDWSGSPLFSKLERMKSDLGGTWTVKAHEPTPDPIEPLSVSITGPGDVQPGSQCRLSYVAVPRGGTWGHTSYVWQTDGTIIFNNGNAIDVYFTGTGSQRVIVTVTDSNGSQATTTLYVTVSATGTACN